MRVGYKKKHTASVVIISLLCTLILLCFCVHLFLKRAEPSFIAQTSNYSNTAFTDLVNKCVIDIAKRDEFSELFKVVETDSLSMVEADTAKINLIVSELMINIQNSLNNDYPAKLYIPLGSLTDYYVLSSLGPVMPVKIIPISVVSSEIFDTFESVGINHTKHSIHLKIWVDMHYSGYLLNERERIETSVPIAETIISGDVPQYYGNGLTQSIK